MSNCQRIRISGVLPSRLKKFYSISLTALPIFLDNNLYCLSLGSGDIFIMTYVMQQSLLVTGIPLHLPQVNFQNELEEASHPSKRNKHHPKRKVMYKKLCSVGKTTTEAEVKTLCINCRE
jgi:hypothetical protein